MVARCKQKDSIESRGVGRPKGEAPEQSGPRWCHLQAVSEANGTELLLRGVRIPADPPHPPRGGREKAQVKL